MHTETFNILTLKSYRFFDQVNLVVYLKSSIGITLSYYFICSYKEFMLVVGLLIYFCVEGNLDVERVNVLVHYVVKELSQLSPIYTHTNLHYSFVTSHIPYCLYMLTHYSYMYIHFMTLLVAYIHIGLRVMLVVDRR